MVFSIKQFLPRTLLGRSLLILVLPVLLIQLITTYVFFDRHWSRMTARLAFAVAAEIAMVTELAEAVKDDRDAVARLQELSVREMDIAFDKLAGETLETLAPAVGIDWGWEWMVGETLSREIHQTVDRPFALDLDFKDKLVTIYVESVDGVLVFTLHQRRLFSSSGYIFLLWMLGVSILLLVVATLFMRNQIRPIRKLAAAARRFGKGQDVAYFKPSGASEVRQAADAFILMHKRIKRSVEQRTAMLAGVSHDLKTPLTRLKLELSMLEGREDVSAMQADIVEMEKMIAGYLDFVRGEGDEEAERVDLSVLLRKIADDARRQGFHVDVNVPEHLDYTLRPSAFERCLVNLVTNAGQYGGDVWVSAYCQDDRLCICVEDNGEGLPESEYEDVFRPFYRGNKARSQGEKGAAHVGLGMSIAMDVVHGHGGKVWLDRSVHGGLAVHISLPL